MSTIDRLLDEYAESHQNKINKTIHWICVPLIMMSLLGALWSIPHGFLPAVRYDLVNFATIFVALVLVYYFAMSRVIFLGMIPVASAMMYVNYQLAQIGTPSLLQISIAIFVAAWIGQFIGHKIEGKKPSFFKDLQFLLIGPAWLLGHIFRKLGIAYSPASVQHA